MNCNHSKTDNLINYVPIISGILLVCFGASDFSSAHPTDVFLRNGLLSLAYLLLFLHAGYQYGLIQKKENPKAVIISQLKFAGIFYSFAAITTLLSSLITDGSAFALTRVFSLLTGGLPDELWFAPAIAIALLIFRLLNKKFRTETIVKVSALFFVFSLLITTYGSLPVSFLSIMKRSAMYVFSEAHCGVFSAMLFVSLGVKFSKKEVVSKKRTLIPVLFASLFLMLLEIIFLSLKADIRSSLFFLGSAPASVAIFCLILKARNMDKGTDSPAVVGSVILFIGQLLCSICKKITVSKDFLFAELFSSPSEKSEVILLLSLITAFAVQAYLSKDRWVDSFAYHVESAIIFLLRPFSYIMTAFGAEVRKILLSISFGALPVLLWFIERDVNHTLCSDLFIVFPAVIILCSLTYPMKAVKKNGTVFCVFLFTAITIYLSARLFNTFTYSQTGRMLLFFFIPLITISSNRKDFLPELMKSYSNGIYLSFLLFISYCLMFRPYDITRYTGAFCNANMCGLYLAAVCATALCNITDSFSKKDLLHWIVFGLSFGFTLLTISRTAFVGVFVAVLVKICTVLTCKTFCNVTFMQKIKLFFAAVTPFTIAVISGLVLSYTSVRIIPALVDRPEYLIYEITYQMEYKVLPGAGLFDKEYVSPLRFLQAWLNRSVGYESVNSLSTGRIDIYLEYLRNLSFSGHTHERIHIEGEPLPMFAHNAFLQIAYNCGIFAGVVFLAYCIFCFVYGLRLYSQKHDFTLYAVIGISTYAACGMFESMEAYYYPLLFLAFMGLLPLACSYREHNSQSTTIPSGLLIEQTHAKQRMQKAISITVIVLLCITLVYFVFYASTSPNKYILNEMLK